MASKTRFREIVVAKIKALQGFTGAISGNVTGNVTGDVTGDVTGNLTGNVTGNTTGDHTGLTKRPVQVAAADGAITIKDGFVVLTKAGVAAMTLADPTATTDDGKELTIIALTANAHTVTIAGGLNGAGAGADVGTFGGAIGDRFSVVAYNGKWYASGVNVNVTFA